MATAFPDDRVLQLLADWEEHWAQGRDVSAEVLCADCPELVDEVRRRIGHLRGMARPLGLLTSGDHQVVGAGPLTDGDRSGEPTGGSATPAPRYRRVSFHARGGLGEVYVAYDTEVGREVALKEMQDGPARDPNGRSRFLREAAITGALEHPGIVPVYGLSTYADGRPYYAMRLIKGGTLGEAIARYHREDLRRLDPTAGVVELRRLLGRFLVVCETIAFAHSRGVIHRDLKPSNIMLGDYGETLVVDWGLAKAFSPGAREAGVSSDAAVSPDAAEDSGSATIPGSVLGTPSYMSPEQADGRIADIGPASDVYSLGATLYCLLTGRSPFEGKRPDEVRPLVVRGEFPRPRAVRPDIPRPLEAICLKAMALEPRDRYESARALGGDIESWMADEPVSAWPEPPSTRARRWTRRHRTLVVSSAAVLAFVLAGLAGFSLVLADKNRELDSRNRELDRRRVEAVEQRNRALNAEQAARDEEAKARKSESESKLVLDFFEKKVLAAARPKEWEGGLGVDATIRAALDAAEPRIQDAFADQPRAEASIRNSLGQSYLYVGEPFKAISQFERARALRRQFLGPDHMDTLDATNNLGFAYRDAGRLPDALPLLEETVKRCQANLGPDHSLTLTAMNNLAGVYREVGRLDEALLLNEETLRRRKATLGPDDPDTLASLGYVGQTHFWAGRFAESVPIYEETLKGRRAKLGPSHADTLRSMNDLATAYFRVGRVADALPLLEETLKQRSARLGPDHPGTLITMNNLATVYEASGRLSDAIPLQEAALKGLRARLGADHADTLGTMNGLISSYLVSRRWVEAEAVARECLVLREKRAPDGWPRFHTMSQLGAALAGQRRHAEAEPLILAGYEGLKARATKIPAVRRMSLVEASNRVVALYDARGMRDKAVELRRKLPGEMADAVFPADPFAP
jgi:serine/threonine protein kinase